MNISKHHLNKGRHNWLIYDVEDRFLESCIELYKGKMYDLGCGEKPYEAFFKQYVDQYIGVDWAQSFHEKKADVIADLNQSLPLESAVADTVIALSVLEHLYEPQTMLNETYRILKPGGVAILTLPWQWWIHEAPHDYFRYTPYGLRYMLKKAGFKAVSIKPLSGFFTMWVLKFNYFTRRMGLSFLSPVWNVGQRIAPFLDKFDRDWKLETADFGIVARK